MIDWLKTSKLIPYPKAIKIMEKRTLEISKKKSNELIWLLEHPSTYTFGTNSNFSDITDNSLFPLYKSNRGGKITYHGPGQLIIYIMIDLRKRKLDIRQYIWNLEELIINTLKEFSINANRKKNYRGVWIKNNKIASVGIHIKKGITSHGVSINIAPDLSYFNKIIPCGIKNYGTTSLKELNKIISIKDIIPILKNNFSKIFHVDLKTF